MKVLGIFFFLAVNVASAERFRTNRWDPVVPEKCRQVELSHFDSSSQVQVMTYSIKGALRKGYTHEYPMDRNGARLLFKIFKNDLHDDNNMMRRVRSKPYMHEAYLNIVDSTSEFDFDFNVEGEILEAMTLHEIIKHLPSDYYVTGGIVYSGESGHQTMGEIDIWVARKQDCRVLQIGEAKLSTRSLGKAKRQLSRFKKFIKKLQRRTIGETTDFVWSDGSWINRHFSLGR